ncbi:MAG TPA: uroporphyrinogen decarboxylase family protein [Armatimonadota bacterium]|nr:uroporphyrinogen decarboxylase family protein [Armatimonadota bacterium]
MSRVNIWLGFMPAYFTKHVGVTYGEAYYFDLAYRADVMRAESRLLHEQLGDFGVAAAPRPIPHLFIQPIDLMLHTQGAPWRFPDDATLESVGAPWATLSSAEIAAIDPRSSAEHPVMDRLLAQYREIARHYGDAADIFMVKSGMMNIHTPYTTAHQLYGEELFVLLLTEPETARAIFAKVWELYQAIYARVLAVTGTAFDRIYLGDCSASLLSEAVYRERVLPVNQRLATLYPDSGYHSCGLSTHLLAAFSALPGLRHIQLGAGTDMAAAARLLPGVVLEPLIDPVLMREGAPDDITRLIAGIIDDTATAPGVNLCAWSFDRDTPLENVRAMYAAVGEAGQKVGY